MEVYLDTKDITGFTGNPDHPTCVKVYIGGSEISIIVKDERQHDQLYDLFTSWGVPNG